MQRLLILLTLLAVQACQPPSKIENTEVEDAEEAYDRRCREFVLAENQIGRKYFFKVQDSTGINEKEMWILGTSRMRDGTELIFMNQINYFGYYSRRAHSWLYIYNKASKKLLGSYSMGAVWDLPTMLKGDTLFFATDDMCSLETRVPFSDSIPRVFYRECTRDSIGSTLGELYYFEKAEE